MGLAFAQYQTGLALAVGKYGATDYAEATRWVAMAAAQGHADAANVLGVLHATGRVPNADPSEALRSFRAGANARNADAEYHLGYLYTHGIGVEPDPQVALRWYRLAASQNQLDALFAIGTFFEYGNGVEPDIVEATRWYRLAADQGYDEAQFKMGLRYTAGDAVERDRAEAVRWYRLAAEQGHRHAQFICLRCDRGQQYCGAGCSDLARRESLRAAGRRYQHSRRGRHCHAERQRRYRRRCREGAHREKVTHHGSASPPRGGALARHQGPMREASPSMSPQPAHAMHCHFCARPVSEFFRRQWRRPPVRRRARTWH